MIRRFVAIYFFFGFSLASLPQIDNLLKEPIDLGWEVNEKTVYWPNNYTYNFSFPKRFENYVPFPDGGSFWVAMKTLCMGEHGGTHLDAPYNFNRYGWKLAQIPLNRLFPNAAFIDLTRRTRYFGSKAILSAEDIQIWKARNGQFLPNTVLLIRFGWYKLYNDRNKYFGFDLEGNKNFPGVSEEAAQILAIDPNIVGVGADIPSIDIGAKGDPSPAHIMLLGENKYIIENVKFPDRPLPVKGFHLIVMPIKTTDGTGSPVRLIAVPSSPLTSSRIGVLPKPPLPQPILPIQLPHLPQVP